mgnify:CR=1 FL=1
MRQIIIFATGILFLIFSCTTENRTENSNQKAIEKSDTKGGLFIIGGGKRPHSLVKDLIALSGIDKEGYIVILPMSSSVPDTSAWYATKQFTELGITNVTAFNFEKNQAPKPEWVDSLKNAKLVYISGGDQNRFMEVVKGTKMYDAIHKAYENGATIAGTSAGAAVMSKKMITGDEYKHPEYTGEFRTIEAKNIEIAEGMGFTDKIIVDQHFVWRMRMNRLISVAIENPEATAVGIDESTAIWYRNNKFKVFGESQVVVIENPDKQKKAQNGLLGARDMKLHILLPGDEFKLNI